VELIAKSHILSVSKTIDSPSFCEKSRLSRSSENCSIGTDSTFPAPIWMQVASLVSANRLVSDERKITQRDTSLDNLSADKAFRRSRESVRARSAHFRRRVFHFRHYSDTPLRRPRKQWPNGVLDIVRVCFAPAPVPFLPFPLNRTDERPIGFHWYFDSPAFYSPYY